MSLIEPPLRFGEFKGEKTNLLTIEDIATIQVARDLKEDSFSEVETDKHSFPVYSNTVVNYGFYGFYDFEEYKGNCLTVVGRGAGLGKAFPRINGFGAIGRLLVITPKENRFDVSYFSNYVNFKLQIHNESGGIPQLPGSTFGKYQAELPSLAEQTKIANFLTAVDEKIQHLTQKADLLAQYKKGVMQQIFSQELRFKDDDGAEFPAWEAVTLGDISNKKSSNISANSLESNEGEYKIFGAAGILKKVDFYTQEEAYISIVKDGAGVGRTFLCEPKTSVLGTLEIIQPKKNININFLHAIMQKIDFTIYVTGSTIPHVYYKDYSKEKLLLPILNEQTKIANFLTTIDDKITHTQTQLAAVKQYKQGLLQQMFV